MKKLFLYVSLLLLATACNDQDGHGGNDEMYGNTNQNAASDNDEHGNDAASPATRSDTITLIRDSSDTVNANRQNR